MDWPPALVTELASRRCLVFLGAGASAGCVGADGITKPPLWKEFLISVKEAAPVGTDFASVDSLIEKERYLDAAEILLAKIAPADFTRIIREKLVQPRFSPSSIHESVLTVDPKIVVTTNYDDIYDTYCRTGLARDGYNVCKYYENHIINDIRSPVRLIVKAHGCVSDASRIVLSRSQYFKERQNNSAFYNTLDALFLVNTVLFVGYSISDPDIQLVLENSTISANSSHTHYAFVEDGVHPDIEFAAKKAYNIHFLKFPRGDYQEANKALVELAALVTAARISNPM